MNRKEYHHRLLEDPEVAAAYRRLHPKIILGRQILELRLKRGWTQKELAKRAHTKQANISRLENALLNPSLDMLQKVADALGTPLTIQILPQEERSVLADSSPTSTESESVRLLSQTRIQGTAGQSQPGQ